MKKFTMFACLALALVLALSSFAGELPRMSRGHNTIHGGSVGFGKAGLDTLNLMSTLDDPTNSINDGCEMPGFLNVEPYYRGDFERGDDQGMVGTDLSGWTSIDITQPTSARWNVSDYAGDNTYPSMRAWCGDATIASCGPGDPAGGYGNAWNELLLFRKTVGNPAVSTSVSISASLQYDTEPAYDFVYLSALYDDSDFDDLRIWDGQSQDSFGDPAPIMVEGSATWLPSDLLDGTDIALYFRFQSDAAWSDEDCLFQGQGACQVDDIEVTLTNDGNTDVYTEDFDGNDPLNPINESWVVDYPLGVGDFARIWRGLTDDDPCNTNNTAQVAFIDDGVVVPGTGGSQCINWCYGPGGYIVTTTGGLAGDASHIHNSIETPVMQWPSHPRNGCGEPVPDGIDLDFGVYRHEDLTADAPGIFYTWGVRSAAPGEDISIAVWQDRNLVYYGGPDYIRAGDDVTDLMVEGRDRVQVQLAVYEYGFTWSWEGNDGYPAPYFDNVKVQIFPYFGPGFSSREIDLANDNWPARGTIDYSDLPSHSVRFDMANNISPATHLRNDPGDSIFVDIVPVRAGSELVENPKLYYFLNRNPIFDAGRTAGLPDIGSVFGSPSVNAQGSIIEDRWAFDLPDTGFLFPGDVLHYYIGASDVANMEVQAATFPADTTGFSTSFGVPMGYNTTFVVHALPSIVEDGFGGYTHPGMLFLNDFGGRGGEDQWYLALNNIGLLSQTDYDIYYTNAPSSGLGNGIGGRTNDLVLSGYTDILYTCGDLSVNTLANGDFNNDPGDDVGVITAWLDQGGKDMFLTGDDLVSDLSQAGVQTLIFSEEYMGLSLSNFNVRPFIGNQTSPLVYPVDANPVFTGSLQSWICFGGCNAINTFDGVTVTNGGVRLAEFNDPLGNGYQFSAATLKTGVGAAATSRTISMPADLMYINTDPNAGGTDLPARAALLRDVLLYFGIEGDPGNVSDVGDTPSRTPFAVENFPNPFNPSTTIKYSMPKAGHLTLNVYNVRGQLVKTLIDGNRPAGADQTIVWDGTNNQGSSVSSGVYFYEARTNGEVKVNKMALVK